MNAMQRREYPIKDYALIGNCETAGLINPDGGLWLCLAAFEAVIFGRAARSRKGGEFFIPIRGRLSRRAPLRRRHGYPRDALL
jgi:hypothetical protein